MFVRLSILASDILRRTERYIGLSFLLVQIWVYLIPLVHVVQLLFFEKEGARSHVFERANISIGRCILCFFLVARGRTRKPELCDATLLLSIIWRC